MSRFGKEESQKIIINMNEGLYGNCQQNSLLMFQSDHEHATIAGEMTVKSSNN